VSGPRALWRFCVYRLTSETALRGSIDMSVPGHHEGEKETALEQADPARNGAGETGAGDPAAGGNGAGAGPGAEGNGAGESGAVRREAARERDERRRKRGRLGGEGVAPSPPVTLWGRRTRITEIHGAHDPGELEPGAHEEMRHLVAGRLISRRGHGKTAF